MQDVASTVEDMDVVRFTTVVKEFDSFSRLVSLFDFKYGIHTYLINLGSHLHVYILESYKR